MGISDLLKKIMTKEEPMELPVEEEPAEKVTVRIENLLGTSDTERVEKLIREGNILFIKIADLQKKDIGQFKEAVEKLRRHSVQFGWDIVAIPEGYLLVTPKFARIERS